MLIIAAALIAILSLVAALDAILTWLGHFFYIENLTVQVREGERKGGRGGEGWGGGTEMRKRENKIEELIEITESSELPLLSRGVVAGGTVERRALSVAAAGPQAHRQ